VNRLLTRHWTTASKSCANPKRLQAICDSLSAEKIDALLRKWLRRLPHPFPARDRQAGYRYKISILQIELSLTQVLDRPVSGRIFFEDVIRENLDIGRPKQVQLIFDRGVTKTTRGSFRTRVITDGVIPSLHIDYKGTRIKQYHKEGQALRTETTINNTRDFYIGKSLRNLPGLRQIGFQANRRLLQTQRITHDSISCRRDVPKTQSAPYSGRATSFSPPLRRPHGTGYLERSAAFRSATGRIFQPKPANQPGRFTRPIRGPIHSKPHDLSVAPTPPPRPD
jgi:hypothetical protein